MPSIREKLKELNAASKAKARKDNKKFRFPHNTTIMAAYDGAKESWFVSIKTPQGTLDGSGESVHYVIMNLGKKWFKEHGSNQ